MTVTRSRSQSPNATQSSKATTLHVVISLALAVAWMTLFADIAVATPPPADFFGLSSIDQLQYNGEAEEMQRLGVHNVRENIEWDKIQPSDCNGTPYGPGLNWSYYDSRVERAALHGITILADLYHRRSSCNTEQFPQRNTSMYNEWTAAGGLVWQVVQRYGVNGSFWSSHPTLPSHPIRIWEIWNEPNLSFNNPGGETVQPQNYARFLIDTSYAVRGAQEQQSGLPVTSTGTKVLLGGLTSENKNWLLDKYLNKVYAGGSYTASEFHNAFDGASFHPYAIEGDASAAEANVTAARQALNTSRTGLNGGSDSNKPLWITELGWPVMNDNGSDGHVIHVTEQQQADNLLLAFSWLYNNATANQIEYAAWYAYQDYQDECTAYSCWDKVSGLKHAHSPWEPRKSWCSFSTLIGSNLCLPSPWKADNLGGITYQDPAIASDQTGHLNVFHTGTDNVLYQKWHPYPNNVGWSPWQNLGVTLAGGPDAVGWGPGRFDVVGRRGDNSILHDWWNGSIWQNDNLGGITYSDPAIASDQFEHLNVFHRGTDNFLYQKWHPYPNSSGWSPWQNLGVAVSGGPDAVSWGPSRFDLVARRGDNTVVHDWWNGSIWQNESLGGYITSDPTVCSLGEGHLDVFARGADFSLMHTWYSTSTGWSPWESLGGWLASSPDCVAWGPNRLDVVAAAIDHSISHFWWEGP